MDNIKQAVSNKLRGFLKEHGLLEEEEIVATQAKLGKQAAGNIDEVAKEAIEETDPDYAVLEDLIINQKKSIPEALAIGEANSQAVDSVVESPVEEEQPSVFVQLDGSMTASVKLPGLKSFTASLSAVNSVLSELTEGKVILGGNTNTARLLADPDVIELFTERVAVYRKLDKV